MKREPVETMNRMDLMRELHEWRTIGPALKAVARAAERYRADAEEQVGDGYGIYRALDRLRRAAPRGNRRTR